MLVMQGADDPYGTEAQPLSAERLAGGPVTVRLLPAAAHAPHLEASAATLDAIAGFVRRLA